MLSSNRRALIAFFVLTFLLSWLAWGSVLAHDRGLLGWQLGETAGFLAVSISAITVTALSGGRAALKTYFGRFLVWRVAPRWYAAALLLPALPAVVALAVFVAVGGRPTIGALVPVAATVPLLLTQFVTHLLTEEAGWRGFALPRLRADHGPVASSLLLGAVWATWHIPLFLLPHTRQTYPFAGFVLQVIAITVVMTWLFDRTRGSVPLAALFHAAMNTSWAVLGVLWGDALLFWLTVASTVALALCVLPAMRRGRPAPVDAPDAALLREGGADERVDPLPTA